VEKTKLKTKLAILLQLKDTEKTNRKKPPSSARLARSDFFLPKEMISCGNSQPPALEFRATNPSTRLSRHSAF
jgi:hypothetical protein